MPPVILAWTHPEGGGFIISKTRKKRNPLARQAGLRGSQVMAMRYPVTSSITIFGLSLLPRISSAFPATQQARKKKGSRGEQIDWGRKERKQRIDQHPHQGSEGSRGPREKPGIPCGSHSDDETAQFPSP
jgi:hypothetical protein